MAPWNLTKWRDAWTGCIEIPIFVRVGSMAARQSSDAPSAIVALLERATGQTEAWAIASVKALDGGWSNDSRLVGR